jgi:hypothetical protein
MSKKPLTYEQKWKKWKSKRKDKKPKVNPKTKTKTHFRKFLTWNKKVRGK